ncbi:MAG TPA: tetratricopeptide repeat protein [Leadbetterella sp.]|nr:tetratricopeptide repeat protein [Leadbetterella sp.]
MAIILICTLVVYSNHFNNDFHFDDIHTIKNNLYIRELQNIPNFFKDASTTSVLPANQAYRPGLTTLNAIDFYLAGKSEPEPFLFHVSIFISFITLGVMCYLLFSHLLNISYESQNNRAIALFTTAWFLLHTANAETINYIIARSDSFSTLMVVLSFIFYIYVPKSRRLHLYFIPSLLGFFVKEPTIMFVPLILMYKLFFEEKLSLSECFSKSSRVFVALKSVLIPLILFLLVFQVSRMLTPNTWQSGSVERWRYLFTQPFVYFHYFNNFILPTNLAVDTDWVLIPNYRDDRVWAGILFVAVLLYTAVFVSEKRKTAPIAFGILWFFIALLPTSSIFPFSEVLNDHRPFFPYIGLFISSATLLRNGIQKIERESTKWVFLVCGGLFLGIHGYGTYQRNEVWKTEESLWRDCTINAPNNPRGWMNYGLALMAKGDYLNAIKCYEKTIFSWPGYANGYINLAIANAALGDFTNAEVNFKKGLELDKLLPDAYSFYADFLINRGRLEEAKNLIEKGLIISPKHQNLLNMAQKVVPVLQATSVIETVQLIGKIPSAENYVDLSLQYYNAGDFKRCIEAAELALTFKPNYDLAYNNICAAYNRLGEWQKAIETGNKGLRINPTNELLKGNLAEAKRSLSK